MSGINVDLVPGRRIVQAWRHRRFPKGIILPGTEAVCRTPGSYNALMVLRGTIQNGVVILEHGAVAPEGAAVEVFVPLHRPPVSSQDRESRRAALAELLAMENENPGDTFSGAELDQALYGSGQ